MKFERGLTLFNLFNFSILFSLYIKFYHIDGMKKYEMVGTFRDTVDRIIGKENNDKYGIYLITFYHYSSIITLILALILVNNLKDYTINFFFNLVNCFVIN